MKRNVMEVCLYEHMLLFDCAAEVSVVTGADVFFMVVENTKTRYYKIFSISPSISVLVLKSRAPCMYDRNESSNQ